METGRGRGTEGGEWTQGRRETGREVKTEVRAGVGMEKREGVDRGR